MKPFPVAGAMLALLPALALAASPKPAQQPEKLPVYEKTFPPNVTFEAIEIDGKPVPKGIEATLMVDGAFRGQGMSGCNNWSATMWPVRDQRLLAGGFSLTRRACPPASMAFERNFLSILASRPTWDLIGDDLIVKSPRGSLRLRRGL